MRFITNLKLTILLTPSPISSERSSGVTVILGLRDCVRSRGGEQWLHNTSHSADYLSLFLFVILFLFFLSFLGGCMDFRLMAMRMGMGEGGFLQPHHNMYFTRPLAHSESFLGHFRVLTDLCSTPLVQTSLNYTVLWIDHIIKTPSLGHFDVLCLYRRS